MEVREESAYSYSFSSWSVAEVSAPFWGVQGRVVNLPEFTERRSSGQGTGY